MATPPLQIVMLGAGPFAAPTFRALLASRHRVAALITRPVRTAPGRTPPPQPMREVAEQHGLPIYDPESVNSPEAHTLLEQLAPDLMVVCDYGQILSAATLGKARLGGINLHGSLLPKYRGAAPVHWAIYHGETETGVTVIHMTPALDAGPAIVVRRTPIGPEETTPQLEERLAELGVGAVLEAIELLAASPTGVVLGEPQASQLATRAPKLRKESGLIDWSRAAVELQRQVRAFQPWPGSYTTFTRDGKPQRLILDRVTVVPSEEAASKLAAGSNSAPGLIVRAESGALWIATGDGVLSLERVQPAGKRIMTAAEFQNGQRLRTGERLGDDAGM